MSELDRHETRYVRSLQHLILWSLAKTARRSDMAENDR